MKRMFVYLWVMICSLGFTACSDDNGNGDTEKGYKVSKITAHFHEDEDEDEGGFNGNYNDEEISLYDGPVGNDVEEDEAADAGYELKDEDDVLGLLDDLNDGADDASDDE